MKLSHTHRFSFPPQDLTLAKKRKRNKDANKMPARLATARFIKRLDKITAALKPGGLQHYLNVDSMLGARVIGMVRTGKDIDLDALKAICGAKPDTIAWATDEEQSQLTGGDYILQVLGVTGVKVNDWFHRVNNDLHSAEARPRLDL